MAESDNKWWQTLAAVLFFVLIVGSAVVLLGDNDLVKTIAEAGAWAPFLLILLKVSTIVVSPLGGSPIYFAVPSLFGYWPSMIYLIIADTIGYTIVFWISRIYGRRVMNKMLNEKQIAWADGMLRYIGNWKGLTIIRLLFAPFADTISYASGLTKISFKHYFWATFVIIVAHVVITNNVSAAFVKDQLSYIIVVAIMISLPAIVYIFRKNLKKMFLKEEGDMLK